MNRRDFLQASLAFGASAAAPSFARADDAQDFDAGAARAPWLAPFKGLSAATQDLHCDALTLTGHWPVALRGRFYRNGPALFERQGQRYRHWFAGDGMVQQFSLAGGARPTVRHLGRMVRTPKLLAEQGAGRFLVGAFGTHIDGDGDGNGNDNATAVRGPDAFNVANINAIEHAGRVLALWEGGSAFALDPKDLSTQGAVTWRPGLEQMPFSAHPKLDAAGHLWNFGTSDDKLVVWHIGPDGRLVNAQFGESPYPGGLVHDAAITAKYIVLPMPPIKFTFAEDVSRAFDYQAQEPLRILVMEKDDIGRRRVFELPAQMMFHVGNAHERADGSIALSFVASRDADFVMHGASALVRGQPASLFGASTQFAVLDMKSGRATVEAMGDAVEFPRVHPQRIGLPARYLLTAASWGAGVRRGEGFHGLQWRDMHTGRVQRHDYGQDTVVEEHIVVPKPGAAQELDAWVLGTTFDVRRQVTRLNLLDVRHLADGPIAQATLPYLLPYGFHGNFTPA